MRSSSSSAEAAGIKKTNVSSSSWSIISADANNTTDPISQSSSSICYDLAIIGRGLIGSAAARHAARMISGEKIVLIGPSEPGIDGSSTSSSSRTCPAACQPKVYGAHYDEGRITRRTDPDPIWAELASRSIRRYSEISQDAAASTDNDAYNFFVECGHVAVGPETSEMVQRRKETAESMGIVDCVSLDHTSLKNEFPYLRFPTGCVGLHEPKESGYISARGLVEAQTMAARNMGVTVIDAVVSKVEPIAASSKEDVDRIFSISTEPSIDCNCINCYNDNRSNMHDIRAKKVLVAAGAFCNARPLLPVKLKLTPIKTQTVHFILSDEDAFRLGRMPSVIFKNEHMWSYFLPPIQYPDKTVRLKLGGAKLRSGGSEYGPSREMSSNEEIMDWYQTDGSESARDEMIELLKGFVPGISPVGIISNSCATLNTPTRQAYIGQLQEGWGVATGGNGYAAKSSDELGRLAALSLLDKARFESESICGRLVCEVLRPILSHS